MEEKDADNIRKICTLCEFIKNYISQVPSRLFWFAPVILQLPLKWKSRNITKHLMSGPSGNSFVFPWVLMFSKTKSRETSGLSGSDIKCILFGFMRVLVSFHIVRTHWILNWNSMILDWDSFFFVRWVPGLTIQGSKLKKKKWSCIFATS